MPQTADNCSPGIVLKPQRKATEQSGARQTAFEILLRVEQAGAYASVLLDHRESQQRDPRDAALLHALVLGVLRRQATLDRLIDQASHRAPERIAPQVRVALRIGAYSLLFLERIPAFAAVDSAVNLLKTGSSRKAVPFANGVLRSLAAEGRSLLPAPPEEGDTESLARFHSHPEWWVSRLVAREGWTQAAIVLQRNNEPATTVLRVNPGRTTVERLAAQLADEGIATEPARFVPDALRVRSGRLGGSRCLADGLAWVQDEAAQLVTCMLGQPLGPRVADLCAAPGGKTLQLADRLAEGGLIVAADRHPGRLRRLAANLRRTGMGGAVYPVVADLLADRYALRGRFDQILLDAPCSGSGTLGRRPEIRWRLREEDLKLLASRQDRMLTAAADLLAPGGSLVYAVCSIEPEEGESVVARFLERNKEFRRADPRPALPAAAHQLIDSDGFLRTSSANEGLDGFFAALIVREKKR
jgi:16S rRNA (cytosine967-C5)-methyltransferase